MENTSNSLLGEKMGGSPRSDRMEFPHNRSVERDCRERTRIAARGNRSTEGHHRCPSWFAEDRRTTTLARSLATVSGLPRCVMALCCFALRRADRLCAEIPESADREASRVAEYIDSTRAITSIFETVGAGCARRAPSFHAEFTKSDDSKIRRSPSEIERSLSSSNLEKARIGFPMSWCISHPQAIVMFRMSSRLLKTLFRKTRPHELVKERSEIGCLFIAESAGSIDHSIYSSRRKYAGKARICKTVVVRYELRNGGGFSKGREEIHSSSLPLRVIDQRASVRVGPVWIGHSNPRNTRKHFFTRHFPECFSLDRRAVLYRSSSFPVSPKAHSLWRYSEYSRCL